MRIAVLTSHTARGMIEELVRGESGVIVVALPVHAIGMLRARTIARILERRRDLLETLRSADVVLIPGSVEGDAGEIEAVVGRPVYKATRSPVYLPAVLAHLKSGGSLSRVEPAERVIPRLRPPSTGWEEAFKIGGVPIPSRGPPMVLVSEVPPYTDPSRAEMLAARLTGDGADVIAVGCGIDEDPSDLEARVEAAASAGRPVVAEAPTRAHARAALGAGADGIIVSAGSAEETAGEVGRDHVVIVGSTSARELLDAEERLRVMGVERIVLDPSVQAPPFGFAESLARLREVALRSRSPVQFTAANVVEEVEADTHGVHALLALAAAEARASIYYVVEDSYKSYRGTAEAREAVDMAATAWTLRRTRDLYTRLLVVKQPHPPPKPPRFEAERVGYVEPVIDKRGYITIHVDHERGVIVAVYHYYRGGYVAVEGRHPTSIARALVRRVGLDAEHAAYLGYELSKAEIALRLGRTYVQDEPVITPVWEYNNYNSGGRLAGGCCERPGEGHTGGRALRGEGEPRPRGGDRQESEG